MAIAEVEPAFPVERGSKIPPLTPIGLLSGREVSEARQATATALAGRLRLALEDLGLAPAADLLWVRADTEGLSFDELAVHEADRFVGRLEDVAALVAEKRGRGVSDGRAGTASPDIAAYEQLRLFDVTPYETQGVDA